MKKRIRYLIRYFLIAVLVISCMGGICKEDAEASGNSLRVSVGFFGGPYYELEVFSYEDMCDLADPQVYIYSGADSGGFMRLSYAWGVPLSRIVNVSDVDLDSVNYFHMDTTDGYVDDRTTFSVATLLDTKRYFYPNMVKMVIPGAGDQQTIRFDEVTEEHLAGAQEIPTILAIASTEFDRGEAVRVGESGEYAQYNPEDLPQDHQYRLLYGQAGLRNVNQAANAQTSDKWVRGIDIQLAGAPNITVDKELVSGEDGKIGSRYSVKLDISLPDSYSYIPEEIRNQLIQQIQSDVVLENYDDSVVEIVKNADGTYQMEIVGEGNTELQFSYSRNEYGGGTTSSSGRTSVSGAKGEEPTEPEPEPEPAEPEPEPPLIPQTPGESPGIGGEDPSSQGGTASGNTGEQEQNPGGQVIDGEESVGEDEDNASIALAEQIEEKDHAVEEEEKEEEEEQKDDAAKKDDDEEKEEKTEESVEIAQVNSGQKRKWLSVGAIDGNYGASQKKENSALGVTQDSSGGIIAGGTIVCLGVGFAATMWIYYRRR